MTNVYFCLLVSTGKVIERVFEPDLTAIQKLNLINEWNRTSALQGGTHIYWC